MEERIEQIEAMRQVVFAAWAKFPKDQVPGETRFALGLLFQLGLELGELDRELRDIRARTDTVLEELAQELRDIRLRTDSVRNKRLIALEPLGEFQGRVAAADVVLGRVQLLMKQLERAVRLGLLPAELGHELHAANIIWFPPDQPQVDE